MQGISGVDAFYTQTNSAENAVVAFAREADGAIVHRETVKTGGKGLATVVSGRRAARGGDRRRAARWLWR
jgi:hypothetical protein